MENEEFRELTKVNQMTLISFIYAVMQTVKKIEEAGMFDSNASLIEKIDEVVTNVLKEYRVH